MRNLYNRWIYVSRAQYQYGYSANLLIGIKKLRQTLMDDMRFIKFQLETRLNRKSAIRNY